MFCDRHEDVLYLWPGHDQLCAGEHSIGKENLFDSGQFSTSGANNDRHIGKFNGFLDYDQKFLKLGFIPILTPNLFSVMNQPNFGE